LCLLYETGKNMTTDVLPKEHKNTFDKVIFISLLLLSMAGVGITDFSPALSHYYWLGMVIIFALAAMATGYKKARHDGQRVRKVIYLHLLHWTGTLLAVFAVYTFLHTGRIDFEQTGLMILLILALATFLDGIRLSWRFSIAGIFLGITTVVTAYVEEFILIIFLIAVVMMVIGLFWQKYR
jgi:hypothetical protein